MTCKSCNSEVNQNYCPNCGQPVKIPRITGRYVIGELQQELQLEKGFLRTIRELAVKPGESIQSFIHDNRSRLIKPILFIIVTSLVYTIISHFFHIDDDYQKMEGVKESPFFVILKWVQENYGYANIIMGVFIALWIKLFFRKYKYNFFEILILLCFVMGMGMLVYSVFALIEGLTHIQLQTLGGLVGFIYTAWAIGQFFEKKSVANFFKAFIAYTLGWLTFLIAAVILTIILVSQGFLPAVNPG